MKRTNDEDILRMIETEEKTRREVAKHFGVSEQYIGKRYKYLKSLEVPESLSRLTEKQQRFAIALSEGNSQTDAAMEAFDCKDRVSAKALGHQMGNDPDVAIAIQDLLHSEGLGKRYRVQKLKAHVDNRDPNVSLKALDQTWRLDGSYAPIQHDIAVSPLGLILAAACEPRRQGEIVDAEEITPGTEAEEDMPASSGTE